MAARQLGGEPQLRAYLLVPATNLYRWLRGEEPVPQAVMTRVIEFLAERESAANPASDHPAAGVPGRKQNLV